MKRLWIVVGIFAIFWLPLTLSDNAFAKSAENKAACEQWCNANKPRCAFCYSNATCEGRTYDVIKPFKEGSGNWYACGLSEYGEQTQTHKADCEAYCRSNPDCVKCTDGPCGSGVKILRTFGGTGENWRACEKTNWAEHSEEARNRALQWCTDYQRETHGQCRIVKSGQSCPDGFYKSERLKESWGRDYWVCLEGSRDTQRVKDCSGEATANIEKALDWVNTHYSTIVDTFRMQPRDYRDVRAHKRMARKFPKVTVQCEDDRNKCQRHGGSTGGWSTGGRYVNLCYDNIEMFCTLVEVIMHETAHNAWVDMERSQHYGHEAPGPADDTVYQFGYRAAELCKNTTRNYSLR